MKDNDSYYMVPGEQALILLAELRETQEISAHLLKYFVESTEVSSWEQTPIPQLSDLYSGSRACGELLESLMSQPPPPEVKDKISGDGFCITAIQYLEFVTMVEQIRTLKLQASTTNGISFEVH